VGGEGGKGASCGGGGDGRGRSGRWALRSLKIREAGAEEGVLVSKQVGNTVFGGERGEKLSAGLSRCK